jgi:hypothetical protein
MRDIIIENLKIFEAKYGLISTMNQIEFFFSSIFSFYIRLI